jgi:hypothetical protein
MIREADLGEALGAHVQLMSVVVTATQCCREENVIGVARLPSTRALTSSPRVLESPACTQRARALQGPSLRWRPCKSPLWLLCSVD